MFHRESDQKPLMAVRSTTVGWKAETASLALSITNEDISLANNKYQTRAAHAHLYTPCSCACTPFWPSHCFLWSLCPSSQLSSSIGPTNTREGPENEPRLMSCHALTVTFFYGHLQACLPRVQLSCRMNTHWVTFLWVSLQLGGSKQIKGLSNGFCCRCRGCPVAGDNKSPDLLFLS